MVLNRVHTLIFNVQMESVIRDLFGDDDDDELELEQQPSSSTMQGHPTRSVAWSVAIPGLSLITGFLSKSQTDEYTAQLKEELSDGSNQKMQFGQLSPWAKQLSDLIHLKLSSDTNSLPPLLPLSILHRSPLFNQIIINSYHPGEGIKAHVDLKRFEDGIAVCSFGGPAIMNFTCCPDTGRGSSPDAQGVENHSHQVLLRSGDLLLMYGEARWKWRHGIDSVRYEVYSAAGGEMPRVDADVQVTRLHRLSVTLRRLMSDIVLNEPG
jgi:alkylated DNA repair dioxygenase AlkB